MKKIIALICLIFPSVAMAGEAARCPFSSVQQVAARDAVDQRMGGRAIDSWMVVGGSVKREDIDKARKGLLAVESWAMDLTDEQLKTDYLCAVMLRRRGLDDAALEFLDGHTKKIQDAAAKKSIQTPPME